METLTLLAHVRTSLLRVLDSLWDGKRMRIRCDANTTRLSTTLLPFAFKCVRFFSCLFTFQKCEFDQKTLYMSLNNKPINLCGDLDRVLTGHMAMYQQAWKGFHL